MQIKHSFHSLRVKDVESRACRSLARPSVGDEIARSFLLSIRQQQRYTPRSHAGTATSSDFNDLFLVCEDASNIRENPISMGNIGESVSEGLNRDRTRVRRDSLLVFRVRGKGFACIEHRHSRKPAFRAHGGGFLFFSPISSVNRACARVPPRSGGNADERANQSAMTLPEETAARAARARDKSARKRADGNNEGSINRGTNRAHGSVRKKCAARSIELRAIHGSTLVTHRGALSLSYFLFSSSDTLPARRKTRRPGGMPQAEMGFPNREGGQAGRQGRHSTRALSRRGFRGRVEAGSAPADSETPPPHPTPRRCVVAGVRHADRRA